MDTNGGASRAEKRARATGAMAPRPRGVNEFAAFIAIFNEIAGYRHRYEVFRDFVVMGAICLHNALPSMKNAMLEAEYLEIIARYDAAAQQAFPKLLAELVRLLDDEPRDILGQLYMQLELGNERTGQFFTPPEISELMARMSFGDAITAKVGTGTEEFVTLCEPACGAGGMVLAFVKVMIEAELNPARAMWVQCQDIDRVAALMCYLQLSLWNIPGVVIVGNTLAMEAREVFYTPAHRMGFWDMKLARRRERELARGGASDADVATVAAPHSTVATSLPNETRRQLEPLATSQQVGFDFGL